MVNTSIYNALTRPVKSVDEWRDEAAARGDREQQRAVNALSMQAQRMQLGQQQQAMDDERALRDALSGLGPGAKDADVIQALEGTRLPGGFQRADAMRKAALEREGKKAEIGKTVAETQAKYAALMKDRIRPVAANPTLEGLEAYITEMEQATGRKATQDRQFLERIRSGDPAQVALAVRRYATAVDQGSDKLLAKLQTTDYGGYKAHESVDLFTGQVTRTGQVENTQTKDNAASNARMAAEGAANRAQQERASLRADSRARDLNAITKELGITEKELRISELRDKQDERIRGKEAAKSTVENQIAVIDKALAHPGRETATGLSGAIDPRNYVPGTQATDFRAVLDQIGGAAFLQAFDTLKGGGAITEVEGKKATDAIARLNRAQSDAEFKRSLQDLRQVMQIGASRLGVKTAGGAKDGGKVVDFGSLK